MSPYCRCSHVPLLREGVLRLIHSFLVNGSQQVCDVPHRDCRALQIHFLQMEWLRAICDFQRRVVTQDERAHEITSSRKVTTQEAMAQVERWKYSGEVNDALFFETSAITSQNLNQLVNTGNWRANRLGRTRKRGKFTIKLNSFSN